MGLLINRKGMCSGFDINDASTTGVLMTRPDGRELVEIAIEFDESLSRSEFKRKVKAGSVWVGNERAVNPLETIENGNVSVTLFMGRQLLGVIIP